MKTTFLSVNNENLGAIARMSNGMAPKSALFTKGSKLPLNKVSKIFLNYTTVLCSTLDIGIGQGITSAKELDMWPHLGARNVH